jgi:hypothetical protein
LAFGHLGEQGLLGHGSHLYYLDAPFYNNIMLVEEGTPFPHKL